MATSCGSRLRQRIVEGATFPPQEAPVVGSTIPLVRRAMTKQTWLGAVTNRGDKRPGRLAGRGTGVELKAQSVSPPEHDEPSDHLRGLLEDDTRPMFWRSSISLGDRSPGRHSQRTHRCQDRLRRQRSYEHARTRGRSYPRLGAPNREWLSRATAAPRHPHRHRRQLGWPCRRASRGCCGQRRVGRAYRSTVAIVGRFSRKLRNQANDLLPLRAGPVSNGEFVPAPSSTRDRATDAVIRSTVDDAVRRLGVDRRRFLQSTGAVAASLAAFELAGCSGVASSSRSPQSSRRSHGGTFTTPSPLDTAACQQALASNGEFIVDVHTHHVIPNGPWTQAAPETVGLILGMLPAGCTDNVRLDCVDRATYLHDMFLSSDTTVAILTDVPNSGPSNAPIPFPEAMNTQQILDGLAHGGANRLLVENVIAPNVGPLGATLDEMSSAAHTGQVAAFKVYTAWSPSARGYSLADPAIGLPTVQHAHDLGVDVFVAHKGLPLVNFDPVFNHPDDVVAVSRLFPDMNFVIYHAAWDPSHVEGPYDPRAAIGIRHPACRSRSPQRPSK